MLDDTVLVRAVASGRQKGTSPRWRRVELRYVDLKAGRRLQVTAYDETQAHTSNHEPGEPAPTVRTTERGSRLPGCASPCSTSRSATGTSRPPPRLISCA